MDLLNKYISKEEYDKLETIDKGKNTKVILSNDAYAINEHLSLLIKQISLTRLK